MRFFIILLCIAGIGLTSCRTQRAINNDYLQNVSDTTIRDSMFAINPVIRKNDLLAIRVYSRAMGTASEREVEGPYNLPAGTEGSPSAGFLVDSEGNIEYPRLGVIHVEGLKREELAALIKNKLSAELTNPTVNVRFLNYKITVLGEVRQPSTLTLPTEHVTILEAIGLAGDVTEYGRRDNVKVYREVDGEQKIGIIDLTSTTLFQSPFYRLQQGDVIFVNQSYRRLRQQEQQNISTQVGITTGIITALAIILNLFRR